MTGKGIWCPACEVHHYDAGDEKRTPEEWSDLVGVLILDPDGWDRMNFEESWSTPITRDDFNRRAAESTLMILNMED